MPGEGRHLTIGKYHHILGSGELVWSLLIRLRLRRLNIIDYYSTLRVEESQEIVKTIDRRIENAVAFESFISHHLSTTS